MILIFEIKNEFRIPDLSGDFMTHRLYESAVRWNM